LAEIGELSRIRDRYGRTLTRGVVVDDETTIILSSTPSEMLLDELGAGVGATVSACGVLRYVAGLPAAAIRSASFEEWLRLFDYKQWWQRFAPSILCRLSNASESSLAAAEVARFSGEWGMRWEHIRLMPKIGRYLFRYRDTSLSARPAVAYSFGERTRSGLQLCPISRDERAMLQIHLANEAGFPSHATALIGATRTQLRWPNVPHALASRFRSVGQPLPDDYGFLRNSASYPKRIAESLSGALTMLGVAVIKRAAE
jgi:hypothetical protein